MEPGSNLPSLADNTLLLILIVFTAADLLAAIILHVYRSLLEENIVIPGGEDKSTNRPVSERLLDDASLIEKLRTGARFLTIMTGCLAVVYEIRVFSYDLTAWILLLYSCCTALILILLEAAMIGLFCRKPQKTADNLAGICVFFSRLFTPLYLLRRKLIPEPVSEVPADVQEEESHLKDWVENIPENTLLEQEERQMIRSIVHFSNTMIREIMIPRVEIDALEKETPIEEAAKLV